MKKRFLSSVLSLGLVAGSLLNAMPSNKVIAEEKKTITLYSGGSDNVRACWDEVIAAFEAKNPGIKVQLEFIASGTTSQSAIDKLIAAEKAGEKEVSIDLVEVNDGDILKLFKEAGKESLYKFDMTKMPNASAITYKSVVTPEASVAFRGTTVVLAYNEDKVKNPPKTAEELYKWIKENPGRFAYNDPTTGGSGDSFVVTAIYNNLPKEAMTSDDPKYKEQWQKGFDLLKELNQYMYVASGKPQYPTKNQGTLDLLANGQVDMIPSWADMALDQKDKGLLPPSIKITQIDPAFTGGLQLLAVPNKSKNKEEASKFVEFVSSVEGQTIFLNKMKAIPVLPNDKFDQETLKKLAGLEIKEFRSYSIGDLHKELQKMWQEQIPTLNQ